MSTSTVKDFQQVLKDIYDETNNCLRVNIAGGDSILLDTEQVPASAAATGTKGTICWGTDAGTTYLYICIDTDTWQRVALATW